MHEDFNILSSELFSQMLSLVHQELLVAVGTYGSTELGHFKPSASAVSRSAPPYVIAFCMHLLSKAGRLRQELPQGRETTGNINHLSFKLVMSKMLCAEMYWPLL